MLQTIGQLYTLGISSAGFHIAVGQTGAKSLKMTEDVSLLKEYIGCVFFSVHPFHPYLFGTKLTSRCELN